MINVIGLGYIGLPTALMFAAHGNEVVGTDYNPRLIETLSAGHASFEEKGLDELFDEALRAGIRFSAEYQKTDFYIVAVPTPYDKDSKKIDPSYVVNAVRSVMEVCPRGKAMAAPVSMSVPASCSEQKRDCTWLMATILKWWRLASSQRRAMSASVASACRLVWSIRRAKSSRVQVLMGSPCWVGCVCAQCR